MKYVFLGVFTAFLSLFSFTYLLAQGTMNLVENTPQTINGVSYGYRIRNEQVKEVKDENYSRYEVEVYVTNNSGCPKVLLFRDLNGSSSLGFGTSEQTVAIFECLNATGKRLTSKNQNVEASIYRMQQRVRETGPDGKSTTRFTDAEVGYGIRNGETASATLIVIVPLGQRPNFTCRAVAFSNF